MCKCVHILFSILNGITAHAIEIEMHHKIKFYDGSGAVESAQCTRFIIGLQLLFFTHIDIQITHK